MTKGYKNEVDFIEYLNNRKYEELNPLMQDVIMNLFPEVKPKDIITARKYGRYAKTDIVVSIRNKKRGISIKCGYKNSVHIEPLSRFNKYLFRNNIPKEFVELLSCYIYSDGTNNNTGTKRISNAEYIDEHKEEVKELNRIFNNIKKELIKRFLIETDIKYRVTPAIFIHGEVNDFIWATREEIEEYLEKENINSTSVHVGKLYIQCWDKNLNRNEKYEYCREYIQVKWFSMYDDIVSILATKYEKLIKLGD